MINKDMKIIKNILVVISVGLICIFMPCRKVWLSDRIIYGKTLFGVSTEGHFTLVKLNNFDLFRYRGHYEDFINP